MEGDVPAVGSSDAGPGGLARAREIAEGVEPTAAELADVDLQRRTLLLAEAATARGRDRRGVLRPTTMSLLMLMAVVLGLPVVAVLPFITSEALAGTDSDRRMLALLYAWAAAAVVVFVGVRRQRGRRRHRLDADLDALAASVEGRRLPYDVGGAGWLDRHWPVTSSADDLFLGPWHGAVATTASGFPVLVDLEPEGSDDDEEPRPRRALVYLAGVPGPWRTRDPEAADGARSRLWAAGFEVEHHRTAGLVARGRPDTLGPLFVRRRLPRTLGSVVPDLAALAVAEGLAAPDDAHEPADHARG